MADSGLLVTISGAALSLLFYENACGVGDQMGFLLGNVVMYVTKNVTDADRHEESVQRHIDITGVLTCPSSGSMYDTTGKLHTDALKDCLRERSKEVVGWFRFRQNNRLAPTFRDKILHKELATYFNDCNSNVPADYFLACIINASITDTQSTHKLRHVLLRYENRSYRPVPLKINNLGGGNDEEASNYMPTPTRTRDHESDVFTKFIKSLNLDLNHKTGSDLVMTIQNASELYLESLIPQLCESDQEVFELERQVRIIRASIVQNVLSTEQLETNESNRRVSINTEGEHSVKKDIKRESLKEEHSVRKEIKRESLRGEPSVQKEVKQFSSLPPNSYEDFYNNKDSTFHKVRSEGKSKNVTGNANKRNNPNKSTVQRSPSEPISYSQATKKSVDSDEDMMSTPVDC